MKQMNYNAILIDTYLSANYNKLGVQLNYGNKQASMWTNDIKICQTLIHIKEKRRGRGEQVRYI